MSEIVCTCDDEIVCESCGDDLGVSGYRLCIDCLDDLGEDGDDYRREPCASALQHEWDKELSGA